MMSRLALAGLSAITIGLMALCLKTYAASPSGTSPVGSKNIVDNLVPSNAIDTTDDLSGRADAWRYRWYNGQWWYWLPAETWVVWNGTAWVPYEQSYQCGGTCDRTYTSDYGSGYGTGYGGGYYSGRGGSGGSDYAGYGWTWGPGTAYSDGPPRRF